MKGIKCPKCGLVNFVAGDACSRCNYDFTAMIKKVTLSTGDVPFNYEIIDIVFAYGNSSETLFKGANPMEAYRRVSQKLEQIAAEIGADAVIWVKYDYRVAINSGLVLTNQVFEVFAYGTAIKLA